MVVVYDRLEELSPACQSVLPVFLEINAVWLPVSPAFVSLILFPNVVFVLPFTQRSHSHSRSVSMFLLVVTPLLLLSSVCCVLVQVALGRCFGQPCWKLAFVLPSPHSFGNYYGRTVVSFIIFYLNPFFTARTCMQL